MTIYRASRLHKYPSENPMRLQSDDETDRLTNRFRDARVRESDEIRPDFTVPSHLTFSMSPGFQLLSMAASVGP